MRRPLGRSQSSGASSGSRFLLVMRLASARRWATSRPPPKLAHVGDHLVRAGVALVGAEHRHAAGVQRVRERLGVGDDRRHVLLAEREQLGGGGGERGDAVDLVGGGERGEDGVEQRRRELRVVPDHHARLRAGERLAGAAGHHRGALAQRVLELAAGDQAELVGAVEEDLAAPLARRSRRSRAPAAGRGSCWRRGRSASAARAAAVARERVEVDLELVARRTGRRRCSGRGCRPGRRGGWSCGRRPAAGSSSPCRRARSARRRRPCCRSCSRRAGARRSCS